MTPRSRLLSVAAVGTVAAALAIAVIASLRQQRGLSSATTSGSPAPTLSNPSAPNRVGVPKANPGHDAAAFRDLAPEAGVTTSHFDASDGRFRLVETMGSGIGLIDFDGDGWLDVFITQGALIPPDPADERHASQLYRNNRDGTFTDVARAAGVAFRGFGQGVAVGDYDRDGDDDLYVSGFNAAALYRNNGDGTFHGVTDTSGLAGRGWQTSCAFADLDGDGDLDLFVVRYLRDTVDAAGQPTVNCNALPGQLGYCPPQAFAPETSLLYRNNGDGTFTDVSNESAVASAVGNGLGLVIADFDDDGRLDIFVANDKTPNLLFHNLGALKFEEVGLNWGVAYNESGEATAGMGIAAGDHDGDGRTDLLVTNFYEEGVTLYRNTAPGVFVIVTARARLRLPTRSKLGFGTGFLDYDNDGRLDLFVANGHVNDVRPLRMPYQMTAQLFHNAGGGRYDDVSSASGPYFGSLRLGRGAAFGDLDNDGDTDIVVIHNTGPPSVLMNETKGIGHSLRLTLAAAPRKAGRARDRCPVGARVTVHIGPERLVREVVAGTSYLSRSDPRLLIGLGTSERADRVEVRWPSGRTEVWTDVPADTPTELAEGEASRLREKPARGL